AERDTKGNFWHFPVSDVELTMTSPHASALGEGPIFGLGSAVPVRASSKAERKCSRFRVLREPAKAQQQRNSATKNKLCKLRASTVPTCDQTAHRTQCRAGPDKSPVQRRWRRWTVAQCVRNNCRSRRASGLT